MYYVGRALQLVGMWILLVSLFTAGPLGPSPRLFAAGIGAFVAGWAAVRLALRKKVPTKRLKSACGPREAPEGSAANAAPPSASERGWGPASADKR